MSLNESKLRKIGFLGGKVKYAVEIPHGEKIFIAFVCKIMVLRKIKQKNSKSSGL